MAQTLDERVQRGRQLLQEGQPDAQTVVTQDARVLDAKARWEMLNLIRRDKFDLILPGAMRDNDIEMWIHSIRMGNTDPLEHDLGAEFGTFVFTDRGGDRIERIVLSPFHLQDRSVYDLVGSLDDLRALVDERDPQRIAINRVIRRAQHDYHGSGPCCSRRGVAHCWTSRPARRDIVTISPCQRGS